MQRIWQPIFGVAVLGAVWMAGSVLLAGECQDDDALDDEPATVFVQPPRELTLPLQRAQRAIDDGQLDEAARILAPVLTGSRTEDYLIRLHADQPVAISMFAEAQRLLSALPPEHRRTIEDRYGVEAQQLLIVAIEQQDYGQMAQIMRRFFHTRAGYLAAMLLGHHHLSEGRAIAAASCFQRVVDCQAAREIHDPEASVLLATAWLLAGNTQPSVDVLQSVSIEKRKQGVEFAGSRVPWYAGGEDPLEWLQHLVGTGPIQSDQMVTDWLMFRGDPQRNAQTRSGFPMKYPRWAVPTNNDPQHESIVRSMFEEMQLGKQTLIPSLQPLAIGNQILMRTADRLVGIDFATGRRQWLFPENLFHGDRREEWEATYRQSLLRSHFSQRLFNDSLYGQVSSDGRRVFIVQDVGFAGGSISPVIGPEGEFNENPLGAAKQNSLKAIDLDRQGAIVWEVGGQQSPSESSLSQCFFLGAALPLDQQLYVLYEQKSEVRLACLDATTGKLTWSQHLANVESRGEIRNDSLRRLAAASPSYSDGILVCPTSASAVVAVDLSTRGLAWGFEYQSREPAARAPLDSREPPRQPAETSQWLDATVTLARGAAVLTPVEDDFIYCIDLLSGRSRWQFPGGRIGIPRGDCLFVAGVFENQVILVARDALRSIDLLTGKELASVSFKDHGEPSGRGFFSEGSYFLPTSAAEIIRIDLTQPALVDFIETDRVLGNLIPFHGDIVSHGVDFVACYPQLDRVARELQQQESSSPLDWRQSLLKAQLLSQQGQRTDAVALADQIYQAEQEDQALLTLLDLIIDLIRNDPSAAHSWIQKYDAELAKYREIPYLDARLLSLSASPATWDPFQVLMEWVQSHVSLQQQIDQNERSAFHTDRNGNLATRVDVVYQNRLRTVWATASEAHQRQLQQWAEQQCRAGTPEAKRQLSALVRLLGVDAISLAGRSLLVHDLIAGEHYLDAERMLFNSLSSQDDGTAGWAHADYAYLLQRAGLPRESLRICQQLESKFADVVCDQRGRRGREVAAEILADLEPETGKAPAFRTGMFVCEPSALDEFDDLGSHLAVASSPEFLQFDSTIQSDLIFSFNSGNWTLDVMDNHGQELASIQVTPQRYDQRVHISGGMNAHAWLRGHLLLLGYGNQLTAIDLFRLRHGNGAVMWHIQTAQPLASRSGSTWRSFSERVFSTSWGEQRFDFYQDDRRIGAVSDLNSDSVYCLIEGNLECLDVDTGKRQWARGGFQDSIQLLSNGPTVGVIHGETFSCDLYSTTDGTYSSTVQLPGSQGKIWWQVGSLLILTADEGPTKKLTGLDVVNNRVQWELEFAEGSRAKIYDARQAVIFEPSTGILYRVDLAEGRESARLEVGKLRGVHAIDLYRFSDRNILAVNFNQFFRSNVSDPVTGATFQSLDYREPLLNGYLFAIDSQFSRLLWDAPAKIELFEVARPVLPHFPLLFLTRYQATETHRALQLAAIDVATGQLAVPIQSQKSYSRQYRVQYFPLEQWADVRMGEMRYRMRYIDEAPPPRAPATIMNERALGIALPFPILETPEAPTQEEVESSLQRLRQRRLELEKKREEILRLRPDRPGGWPTPSGTDALPGAPGDGNHPPPSPDQIP